MIGLLPFTSILILSMVFASMRIAVPRLLFAAIPLIGPFACSLARAASIPLSFISADIGIPRLVLATRQQIGEKSDLASRFTRINRDMHTKK